MSAAWRNLRWLLAYWTSRIGAACGRFLPTRLCYALANPIADACYWLLADQRRIVEANLRRVVGEEAAAAAAKRVFRNFARYIIDFYQLPYASRDALCRRIEFHDWRRLNEALAPGAGGLFVTLHLGQAELGGGALAAYGHPISVIADTLSYPPMNAFVQGLRRRLGMKIIAARRAKPGVLRCLNRGEVLGMMIDVVEPGDGVMVDFFGAPVEFSSAPARIAIKTGARVMPGVVGRDPRDPLKLLPCIDFDLEYERSGDEEADVLALTQAIARSLEAFVRRFPDQWFAFRPLESRAAPRAPAHVRTRDERWRLWALQAGFWLDRMLPRWAAYGLGRLAGDFAYLVRRQAREDVRDNMRHVLGVSAPASAVDAAAREAFRNVARYYVDLIRVPRMDLARCIGRSVRLHGLERVTSRLDAGQGVVVATAHFGNPEIAVQVGAILDLKVLVLTEPLQPPAFARIMRRLRSAFGPRYVDVSLGGVAEALNHLRSGGLLAITFDRDIQGTGVPLPFFGQEARLPLGAVEIAARTGAALIPGYCKRAADGGFDIYFEEPLPLVNAGRPKDDARVNARALLARGEAWIRSDPGQWMPLERIWKPIEKKAHIPLAVVRPLEGGPSEGAAG